jgi:hypothetical protein
VIGEACVTAMQKVISTFKTDISSLSKWLLESQTDSQRKINNTKKKWRRNLNKTNTKPKQKSNKKGISKHSFFRLSILLLTASTPVLEAEWQLERLELRHAVAAVDERERLVELHVQREVGLVAREKLAERCSVRTMKRKNTNISGKNEHKKESEEGKEKNQSPSSHPHTGQASILLHDGANRHEVGGRDLEDLGVRMREEETEIKRKQCMQVNQCRSIQKGENQEKQGKI